jgi:hypothetical protein
VRLGFAETFTRRVQRDRRLIEDRLEVREPSLGLRNPFGDDHEEPCREPLDERGERHRVARADKSANRQALTGCWNRVQDARERRQR